MGRKSKTTIIQLSQAAAEENNNLSKAVENNTMRDMVTDYCALPLLPTNKEVTIRTIGVYNFDPIRLKTNTYMKYSWFSDESITDFPLGENSDLDYMPDDYVAPVVIIDINNNRYRTDYRFWFPLSRIQSKVLKTQGLEGKLVFPMTLFIDEGLKPKWLLQLLTKLKV